MVQGPGGDFYGTTSQGGAADHNTPTGELTTLYNFREAAWWPVGRLPEGPDGDFYGTTNFGGSYTVPSGYLAELEQSSKVSANGAYTNLYNFCSLSNCADGLWPSTALTLGTDGD